MAYEIIATPEMLNQSADTVDTNADTIRHEVEGVNELLGMLRQTFIGRRAADFFQRYDSAHQDMQEWDRIVRSFAQEMRDAASNLNKADTPS